MMTGDNGKPRRDTKGDHYERERETKMGNNEWEASPSLLTIRETKTGDY